LLFNSLGKALLCCVVIPHLGLLKYEPKFLFVELDINVGMNLFLGSFALYNNGATLSTLITVGDVSIISAVTSGGS
jgi:hypothetical protein